MNIEIQVENIKCGGCASTITKKLMQDERINQIDIDIEKGLIKMDVTENAHKEFCDVLLNMGYPETGTAEGIVAAKAKAKSFVSCAVGKVDNMVNKK